MRRAFWKHTTALALSVFGLLWTGCRSSAPTFSEDPILAYRGGIASDGRRVLQVGDSLTIHLPDGSPPFEDRVKEDGTITLPLIGSMAVVGKTAPELEKQLRENYARIGIVLPSPHDQDLYYVVVGEVIQSGPKAYIGETTVIKAIQAAGGFAEFSNRKRIKLIHANGRTEIVDLSKTAKESAVDRFVIPGDSIVVPRRFGFGL